MNFKMQHFRIKLIHFFGEGLKIRLDFFMVKYFFNISYNNSLECIFDNYRKKLLRSERK